MRYRKSIIFTLTLFLLILTITGIWNVMKKEKLLVKDGNVPKQEESNDEPIEIKINNDGPFNEKLQIKNEEITKKLSEETESPEPENLKEGLEHTSVSALQERLMELGFMENDEPTQYYGPVTAAAVRMHWNRTELSVRRPKNCCLQKMRNIMQYF